MSLTLLTDRFPEKLRKPSVLLITALNLVFTSILFGYGLDKVLAQLEKTENAPMCLTGRSGFSGRLFPWSRLYDSSFY